LPQLSVVIMDNLVNRYAGQTPIMDKGSVYPTGIMHDIGRVLLAITKPGE